MTNRDVTLALTAAAAVLVAVTIGPNPAPRFVWNASESVPTGLYGVQPAHRFIVTDLVVAFPPEQLATVLAEGGYLPRGVPLIKRVLALPEQIVCRKDLTITVDGIEMGAARERDSRGRLLPGWKGCRTFSGRGLAADPSASILTNSRLDWRTLRPTKRAPKRQRSRAANARTGSRDASRFRRICRVKRSGLTSAPLPARAAAARRIRSRAAPA